MFRFFENLVDPFQPYAERTPSANPWQYILDHLSPFRAVMALASRSRQSAHRLRSGSSAMPAGWSTRWRQRRPTGFGPPMAANFWPWRALVLIVRSLAPLLKESLDDISFKPAAVNLMVGGPIAMCSASRWAGSKRTCRGRIANACAIWVLPARGRVYAVLHTLAYVAVYSLASRLAHGSGRPAACLAARGLANALFRADDLCGAASPARVRAFPDGAFGADRHAGRYLCQYCHRQAVRQFRRGRPGKPRAICENPCHLRRPAKGRGHA